jgi:hypothetical protein
VAWEVIEREPLVLPVSENLDADLWATLIELTEHSPGEWTLIGGLMVFVLALENGETPPRLSTDIDVLVNARIVSNSIPKFVRELEQRGFELAGISADNVAHRYHRRGISVDVLSPEGVGSRANLSTTSSGHTVQVPGGSQALDRTELLPIVFGVTTGYIPRPSLLGAIICKACAVFVDDVPDAQRLDLAFLLSLVDDPLALRNNLTSKDRKRLLAPHGLSDPKNPAWAILDTEAQDRGRATLRLLTGG